MVAVVEGCGGVCVWWWCGGVRPIANEFRHPGLHPSTVHLEAKVMLSGSHTWFEQRQKCGKKKVGVLQISF